MINTNNHNCNCIDLSCMTKPIPNSSSREMKWIKFDEQSPPSTGKYLVSDGKLVGCFVAEPIFNNVKKILDELGIKHWMPLPNPPEDE